MSVCLKCLRILITIWSKRGYSCTPKHIKLYALNMYSFLYVSRTSIKWWGEYDFKEMKYVGTFLKL